MLRPTTPACRKTLMTRLKTGMLAALAAWSAGSRAARAGIDAWSSTPLLGQAETTPVETQSGSDFVLPGIVVVVVIGIAVYAVARSSRRV